MSSVRSLNELKLLHPFPILSKEDWLPTNEEGAFPSCRRDVISKLITFPEEVEVIIEVGSWLGLSTRWFLNICPNATIVCVDLWNPEVFTLQEWREKSVNCYRQFLSNMLLFKDRVIPIRMNSSDALPLLSQYIPAPDIVFIDGDHSAEQVRKDVTNCCENFPLSTLICGDDFNFKGVKGPVRRLAKTYRRVLETDKFIWSYKRDVLDDS